MGGSIFKLLSGCCDRGKTESCLILVAKVCSVELVESRAEPGGLIEQIPNGDPALSRVALPLRDCETHWFVKFQHPSADGCECPQCAKALGDTKDIFRLIRRSVGSCTVQTATGRSAKSGARARCAAPNIGRHLPCLREPERRNKPASPKEPHFLSFGSHGLPLASYARAPHCTTGVHFAGDCKLRLCRCARIPRPRFQGCFWYCQGQYFVTPKRK